MKYCLAYAFLLVMGCHRLLAQGVLQVVDAFPNLAAFANPIELTHAGDYSGRVFVAEQAGVIRVLPHDSAVTDAQVGVFLDIRGRVTSGGERGLLGLAFDPAYAANGYFYLNYTRTVAGQLQTVVSRWRVQAGNAGRADPASERVLLVVNQPLANHNGGKLTFGNDGYLYIALGDGGGSGDPQNHAQNLGSLLGKILRINVRDSTAATPYAIPPDNPFISEPAARPEIYAYGLRNPWRMAQDRLTGRLWAGDVGQNAREEIDLIAKGGNYGWRFREGKACYNPAANCPVQDMAEPVWDYTHASGDGRSVTGGLVYRGELLPSLYGKYVYGDFVSGNLWALSYDSTSRTATNQALLRVPGNIAAFGEAQNGELFLCNFRGGRIQRLKDLTVTATEPGGPAAPKAQVFPNPADGPVQVVLRGVPSGPVAFRLYSLQGRAVRAPLRPAGGAPGERRFVADAAHLPPGTYTYHLDCGGFSQRGRLTVLR